MKYNIFYSCISHIGNCRKMNQDNFICNGQFIGGEANPVSFPLSGCIESGQQKIMGVFDGMGGEECGEIAALIAAQEASQVPIGKRPIDDMADFCKQANEKICQYAADNSIKSMGTTAALLAFIESEIILCNIGDSKIFYFYRNYLEQISVDHLAIAAYGTKPPLSQNLGIPPDEMEIEPYIARGQYRDGDMYLICSDGLTDMLKLEEIASILLNTTFDAVVETLVESALANGGKDNITIMLLRIEREKDGLLSKIFKSNRKRGTKNDK